jgi:hypothetical protein
VRSDAAVGGRAPASRGVTEGTEESGTRRHGDPRRGRPGRPGFAGPPGRTAASQVAPPRISLSASPRLRASASPCEPTRRAERASDCGPCRIMPTRITMPVRGPGCSDV